MTRMDLLASIDSLDGLSSVTSFSPVRFFFQSMTGSLRNGSRTDRRMSRLSLSVVIADLRPPENAPSKCWQGVSIFKAIVREHNNYSINADMWFLPAPVGPNPSNMLGVNLKGITSGRGRFSPLSKML